MREIGHPILGDPFYATGAARDFPRLMLHAEILRIRHPEGGRGMNFSAPTPVLILPALENSCGTLSLSACRGARGFHRAALGTHI